MISEAWGLSALSGGSYLKIWQQLARTYVMMSPFHPPELSIVTIPSYRYTGKNGG
jgi:hypothetical protein